MTGINWGLGLGMPDAGQAFQQGMQQGRANRERHLAGGALNALLADPNQRPEQLNALAQLAPERAMALLALQQGQQDRDRNTRFRAAQSEYVAASLPAAGNALAPFATGNQSAVASGVPSISDAPPPPSNWREIIGNPIGTDATGDAHSLTAPQLNAIEGADQSPSGVMPASIARAAQSPSMDARNRAFMEMVKIDPIAAMKIDSEMRDAALDRLEGADKAYRLAIARLPRVQDDQGYQQVLSEVDALLAPLGTNIRETVPPSYPGPEGMRELLMKAMDAQQQLAAIDRRFSAEARVDDIEADNERQDRNTDSLIADRSARTGIARDRAAVSAGREARLSSGKAGGKKGGGKPKATAVNPKTGERLVLRRGKWVPAK